MMIQLILYTVVPVYLLISAAYAVHPAVVEIISKVQLQAHSHALLPQTMIMIALIRALISVACKRVTRT